MPEPNGDFLVGCRAGSWTLHVREFRAFQEAEWSGDGVVLLVGPNGSGKTTLLDALELLRNIYNHGPSSAINYGGGAIGQRRLDAVEESPTEIALRVQDVTWRVTLPSRGGAVDAAIGEVVSRDGQIHLRRGLFAQDFFVRKKRWELEPDDTRCALRRYVDSESSGELRPLTEFLRNLRVYKHFAFDKVADPPPTDLGHRYLHPTGRDLFYVLHQWRSAPTRFNGQFDWVLQQARRAFPQLISDIDVELVGRNLAVRFQPSDVDPRHGGFPVQFAADGLVAGLLILTAVAGAQPGTVIGIDEMENYLHPYAIRVIADSIRERAAEHDLTVLLTTHSPVLLNAWRDEPEHVHVIESHGAPPQPLTELRDPEWLAHFALGTLYERLEIGAPKVESRR